MDMEARTQPLMELSSALTTLATEGAASVVRVEGRRRTPASGIAWSDDGLVAAPHHAVEWDEEVEVGLPDGETVAAEVIGRDATTDVALLRAKGARLVPPAFGTAPVAAGQVVIGLSRPGRTHRVALGIVGRAAGEWRAPAGGKLDRYLETTLPRIPGLSGSLALDPAGAAMGMATAGLVRGLAMVVPAATLRRVVESLLAHGHVPRGYLGIATLPVRLPPATAKSSGQAGALLVSAVEEGSPAAKAGLLLGDAILALDGAPVTDPHVLLVHVEPERIGSAIAVRLLRAGEARELTLTVGARRQEEGA
jgi:S1-C subfamily serine protease